MKMNKATIIFIILIAWAVFSVIFIARNYWQNFKVGQLNAAYIQGHDQAIVDVATEVSKCDRNGVPLNLGNDKDGKPMSVVIIAPHCFQPAAAETSTEPMIEK